MKFVGATILELALILTVWLVISGLMTGALPDWSVIAYVSVGWVLVALSRVAAGALLARRRRA